MDNQLRDILMPISVIGSVGAAVYYFTKTMTDYILRKKMIDKGFVNDTTQAIFKNQSTLDERYSALKWGLIVFSAGLALIVISLIDIYPNSPLPYGLFAVFVSGGFLAYYFIVQKANKNKPE